MTVWLSVSAKLSRITKSIKNFSARQANAILGHTGQPCWRGWDELEEIAQYIEENPVAAGLVERVEAWRWSSAFGKSERQARRPVPLLPK